MDRLEQFYDTVGSSVDEVTHRLGVARELIAIILKKFYNDKSFQSLSDALQEGDTEKAFHAAHALKGVCANLGFQSLFTHASDVTEFLRAGHLEEAKEAFPALESEYHKVLAALDTLTA